MTILLVCGQRRAGAFGSCRYKLKKSLDQHRVQYERLLEVFKAHDIGYFYITVAMTPWDTAHKVSQFAEEIGYPLRCIGIPKQSITICR